MGSRFNRIGIMVSAVIVAAGLGMTAIVARPWPLFVSLLLGLYEAMKERGSLAIVPSTAVETLGLGTMLATASMGGAKLQ